VVNIFAIIHRPPGLMARPCRPRSSLCQSSSYRHQEGTWRRRRRRPRRTRRSAHRPGY
jgi:hypothetical protein